MSLQIIARVAARYAARVNAGGLNDIVVFDDDELEGLSPEDKKKWKGYTYRMAYETWDEEALEAGETDDKGWDEEGSEVYDTLDDVIRAVDDNSWSHWSSTHPDGKRDWLVSDGDEDPRTGERTSHHLWVERKDGKPLDNNELKYLSKKLRVRM